MNINELKKYQEQTGLNFVMGGDGIAQMSALQNFKDLIIAEYIYECSEALADKKEIGIQINQHITDAHVAKIYEETMGQSLRLQDQSQVNKFARAVWLDAVTAYGRTDTTNTAQVKLPDGLPRPNERVAIVDKFGKLDFCTFITTSDGRWYWDNLVDCIYQPDEVKEWKTLVN